MTAERVRGYLARLGVDEEPQVNLEWLRRLHAAHLDNIPFENLSIHLPEPIVLEPTALVAKVVDLRRGGFCYELNGAFATLLRALGFDVTMLAARVFDEGRLGPPFDHMCLRVDLDEPWLADVGFGDHFRWPLRLHVGLDQQDQAGVFRLVETDEGEFDLLRDGTPQYRFDLTAHDLQDYQATCAYHQTSPESHFTRNSVCTIPTSTGRTTISGRRLILTADGHRTERELDDAQLRQAYREHFGIVLDRLPAVGPMRSSANSDDRRAGDRGDQPPADNVS
jgi:N-hydroxyarylamine O-acetyltransferase